MMSSKFRVYVTCTATAFSYGVVERRPNETEEEFKNRIQAEINANPWEHPLWQDRVWDVDWTEADRIVVDYVDEDPD